jgi:hypothetical protein
MVDSSGFKAMTSSYAIGKGMAGLVHEHVQDADRLPSMGILNPPLQRSQENIATSNDTCT